MGSLFNIRNSFLSKVIFSTLFLVILLAPFQGMYAQGLTDPTTTTKVNKTAYEIFQNSAVGCKEKGFINKLGNVGDAFLVCLPMLGLYISSQALFYSANVFDNLLFFSVDSSFLRMSMIDTIWTSLKDVANIAFILALIYISFSLILNIKTLQAKNLFVRVIIIALVLNFSLFASRVIIDAGNITALTFYNSINANPISAENDLIGVINPNQSTQQPAVSTNKKTISGAVLQIFNPLRLFDNGTFADFTKTIENEEFKIFLLLVSFSTIMFFMAVELLFAGAFFLVRILWLIVLMVVSPIAFVSYFLPGTQNVFKKWFITTLERSFCLIPYIFAIWMLILITGKSGRDASVVSTTASVTFNNVLMSVLIQFLLVYLVIKTTRKYSSKLCEGGSGIATSFVDGGTKFVKGTVASGALLTTGVGLQATVGKTGYAMARSRTLSNMATSKGKLYSPLSRLIGQAGTASGDRLASMNMGLAKNTGQRVDARKDLVKTRANRDAQNLGRDIKDADGNVIKPGMNKKDARKRAAIRAEKSGIFGYLAGGLTGADKEAAEELNTIIGKDNKKNKKTKELEERKTRLARQTATESKALKRAATNAVTAGGSELNLATKEGADFFKRLEKVFETIKFDANNEPEFNADGTLAKEIKPADRAELEQTKDRIADELAAISFSNAIPEVKQEQAQAVLGDVADVGAETLKGKLRTEQNMASAELEHVYTETQSGIEALGTDGTGRVIDVDVTTQDADTPGIGGNDGQTGGIATRTNPQQAAANKLQEKRYRKEVIARDNLYRMTKAEFDQLDQLIAAGADPTERSPDIVKQIGDIFGQYKHGPDLSGLSTMNEQDFRKLITDSKNSIGTKKAIPEELRDDVE